MNSRRPIIILAAVAALLALPVYSVLGGSSSADPPSDYRVSAQVALGDAFTYQGRLTENNQPANGTYDLQFTIFGAASGSAQVCTTPADDVELRGDTPVAGGLFTVQLEFCPEAFDGDARWLEIAVRAGNSTGNYTTLSPRQPISPTPYALYSKRAAAVDVPFSTVGESQGDQAILEVEQQENANAGPAIDIDGAIRVTGNQAAFNVLTVDDNLCNSDAGVDDDAVIVPDTIADEASDLLFVTPNGLSNDDAAVAVAFGVGDCGADTWVIHTIDNDPMPEGASFNVLVIKQEG